MDQLRNFRESTASTARLGTEVDMMTFRMGSFRRSLATTDRLTYSVSSAFGATEQCLGIRQRAGVTVCVTRRTPSEKVRLLAPTPQQRIATTLQPAQLHAWPGARTAPRYRRR